MQRVATIGGRVVLKWVPTPQAIIERVQTEPVVRTLYGLGRYLNNFFNSKVFSCCQVSPPFKNGLDTYIIVATARHNLELYKKTHVIDQIHYSREINTNRNNISSQQTINCYTIAYLLRYDSCFPAEIMKAGCIIPETENDWYYGTSPQTAKKENNKWEIEGDCAFIKVKVPEDQNWEILLLPNDFKIVIRAIFSTP